MSSIPFVEIGGSIVVLALFLVGLVFYAENRRAKVGWSLGVGAAGVSVWMETPLGESMGVGHTVVAVLFGLAAVMLFTAGGPAEA
jgi:hypothetical protein